MSARGRALPMLLAPALVATPPVEQMKQQALLVLVTDSMGDKRRSGSGSGFPISDRHVVTNWHVCCRADLAGPGAGITTRIQIGEDAQHLVSARVLLRSTAKDLAILETERPMTRAPVRLVSSQHIQDGQKVWAVGFPGAANLGAPLEARFVPTLTSGIVSKQFSARMEEEAPPARLIQTDAAINPGNSGGPLFDDCGNLVGVNRAKALTQVISPEGKAIRVPEADGISWAVHVSELVPELDRLKLPYQTAGGCADASTSSPAPSWMIAAQLVTGLAALGALVLSFKRRSLERVRAAVQAVQRSVGAALRPRPAPPKPAIPALAVRGIAGQYAGSVVPLDQGPLIFGRDAQVANLVFAATTGGVSKRHCQVTFDAPSGNVFLEDTWSTSGTFLASGVQLAGGRRVPLHIGDRFYLGSPENMFEIATAGEVTP